jgi:23S rRNA pseudouridine1911/1915/1917 synthase
MSEKFKGPESEWLIAERYAGQRLDQVLAQLLPEYSRTRLKAWIEEGQVLVDGGPRRPRDLLQGGEHVRVHVAVPSAPAAVQAEVMPLHIVYEDAQCLVIDKPAGLVVHPGAGNAAHTLQNALLGYDARLAALPRAGLIHRLDKDTSGLLLIARNLPSHASLVRQLAARSIAREYDALCVGVLTGGGTVDAPIGRHRADRLRMAIRGDGRRAVTHYRLQARFRAHSHVRVSLETGRTHQIRVHMAHIGYPIVGDPTYGKRLRIPAGASPALAASLQVFGRQALHASSLGFAHPQDGRRIVVASELPQDFQNLVALLAADAREMR